MKKYTIVSTYPTRGSRNIGDALISQSTMDNILAIKSKEEINFNIVWREDTWVSIKDGVLDSDAVIFACLAVRDKMTEVEYPFLNEVLKSQIPVAILAAGTSLNFTSNGYQHNFTSATIESLKDLNKKALFFTSRGALTHWTLLQNGISNSKMFGDVAFCDDRFYKKKFLKFENINRIIISDPHKAPRFLPLFKALINGLKKIFPNIEPTVGLHGINPIIENYCHLNNVKCLPLYKSDISILDCYSEFDLHVGFRVHGHVNMLKRRKPSYLIEQDGRGCDYGLTLDKRISVTSHFYFPPLTYLKASLAPFFGKNYVSLKTYPTIHTVNRLLALIETDYKMNPYKFIGLENQLDFFIEQNRNILQKLP